MDTETGMYYLMSRYYDPVTHRFLNCDSICGVLGNIETHNVFSYCGNNPIIRIDSDGHFFGLLGAAFIATTIAVTRALCAMKEANRVAKEIASIPTPKKDVTKSFRNTLKANATTIQKAKEKKGFIQASFDFYYKVRNGGEWDLKQYDSYQGQFKFNDLTIEAQDFGNINYGYTGKALGFPDEILLKGAGIAQIKAGTSNFSYIMASNGDDLRDQIYIMYGIQLFLEDNGGE